GCNGFGDDVDGTHPPRSGGSEEDEIDLAARIGGGKRPPALRRLQGFRRTLVEEVERAGAGLVVEIAGEDPAALETVEVARDFGCLGEPEGVVLHPVEVYVDDRHGVAVDVRDLGGERDARLVAVREPDRLDAANLAVRENRHAVAAALIIHESTESVVHP